MATRDLKPRYAHYASFFDAGGEVLDQGLVLSFPAPNSFTGEHVIELHAHGGPVVLDSLINRCIELGARAARPGEFSERAFLNDKLDLAQAEAVADLIDASSNRQQNLLFALYRVSFLKNTRLCRENDCHKGIC